MSRLVIVTATTSLDRSAGCRASWGRQASDPAIPVILVRNGAEGVPYLGTVAAFRQGVDRALAETDADIIACFHDDLEILQRGWDAQVIRHFDRQPACGLAGFGGALGLGASTLYRTPYDPMQLAREGFRSNLVDAEAHGLRSTLAERVACLDGFSQIGRRAFWEGATRRAALVQPALDETDRPWTQLDRLGVIHHFYDGMLGCLAARYGWETWYLPVACRHYGGQTAVGDPGYHAWINAKTHSTEGDHEVWKAAHRIGYEEFRDVLPLRVR